MADVVNRRINIYIDQSAAEVAYKNLQAQQDALTRKIAAGEAAGKSMISEYKKLDQIKTQLQQLQAQMDSGLAPTLQQQTNLVRQLYNELRRMSASDPNFAARAAEYREQNEQLQRMRANISGVSEGMNVFKKVFETVAESFVSFFAIEKAIDFVKEIFVGSIEEADQAKEAVDSLKRSLDNAGRSDIFDRLLSKSDEFAEKYKRLDNDDITGVFSKLVTYGKLTGSEMENLTDIIINFAAKQKVSLPQATDVITRALEGSGKSLKEYGINIKDGANVTERIGIIMDTLGPKVRGSEQDFEQTAKGGYQVFLQRLKDIKEAFGTALLSITEGPKTAIQEFSDLSDEVGKLTNNILPLADRYDELKGKTKLSRDEQTELKKIVAQISDTLPGAATEFDKYGNAISISTSRVRDFIDAEKARLKVVNSKAIEEYSDKLADVNKALEGTQRQIDQIKAKGTFDINEYLTGGGVAGTSSTEVHRQATQDEVKQVEDHYKQLLNLQLGYNTEIKRLDGQSIDEELAAQKKAQEEQQKLRETEQDREIKLTRDKLSAEQIAALLKEVEAFNKKVQDLSFANQQATKNEDQKEIDQVKFKYAEILKEYEKLAQKLKGSGLSIGIDPSQISAAQNEEINNLIDTQNAKHTEERKAKLKKNLEEDYNVALNNSAAIFEGLKKNEAERFTSGVIDEKQYLANIAALDVKAKLDQQAIAKDFSQFVKQADTDLTKFKKDTLDKQTADLLAAYQKQEANRKQLQELDRQTSLNNARTKVAIAPTQDERYKAQLALDALLHKQDIDSLEERRKTLLASIKDDGIAKQAEELQINADINNQVADANAQFQKEQDDKQRAYYASKIEADLGYVNDVLNIISKLNSAQTANENAALQQQLKNNDAQKKQIQTLANTKVISQVEANRQIAALDIDADNKKKDLEKKQFLRNQKMQIAQTLMNAAEGMIKLWANPGFPAAIPLAIALGVETVAEIAAIASQKPAFGKGGRLTGPAHSEGGMPVINPRTGQKEAEVEGGEYILSKATVANNRTLADMLLNASMYRNGASVVMPQWQTRSYKTIDFNGITTTAQKIKFATGGVMGSVSPGTPENDALKIVTDLVQQTQAIMVSNMETNAALNQQLKDGITTVLSLRSLDQANDQRNRILADAKP